MYRQRQQFASDVAIVHWNVPELYVTDCESSKDSV